MAGAPVSSRTNAVAVVECESSMVRLFDDGKVVAEIVPEIWMLDRHTGRRWGLASTRPEEEFAVVHRTP